MDGDLVGGPWRFDNGNVESVRRPDTVIVDSLYLSMLGVHQIGDEVEVFGKRARLGAVSSGVRTFTALPFVFTSMRSAVRYDQRYRDDETTYVLARCEPGTTSEQLRDKIKAAVPQVEVLTSREFAIRTVRYWMLGTGMGITVIVTATLGLIVGTVIISQTLYAITQDHLNDYAALLAIGFSHRKLVGTIGLQALGMGICGTAIGAVLFAIAARATASSPIPLEMTAQIFPIICAVSLACCIAASFLSVRAIFKLDPVQVFRA
jgi:putative ABC transport system permease protein